MVFQLKVGVGKKYKIQNLYKKVKWLVSEENNTLYNEIKTTIKYQLT